MMSCSLLLGGLLLSAFGGPPATEEWLTVDGLIRISEQVEVPARSEGRLESLLVKEGAVVQQGARLGQLNDEQARLAVERAQVEQQLAEEKAQSETSVLTARLTRDVAVAEFERARLAKKQAPASISNSEYDKLKLDAEKAGLELTRLSEERRFAFLAARSKTLETQLARHALEERQITAPFDGMIVQVFRHAGEWVRPGEKTVRLVRLDRLRVEAFVPINLRISDWKSLPVAFQVDGPKDSVPEFPGTVVFDHPEADPVNGQIRIWAEVENREGMLRPGQRGRLKIRLPATVDRTQTATPPADKTERR